MESVKRLNDELTRGEALLRGGYAAKAEALALRVLHADSGHLGALELLARAQWQLGSHEDVVRTTKRLLVLNPYEPGYRALQGAALQCLGRSGEAARAYAACPNDPLAREALEEVRIWQADLVVQMLRADRVFRAHYRRDPQAACAARGFDFADEFDAPQPWASARPVRAASYVRPS